MCSNISIYFTIPIFYCSTSFKFRNCQDNRREFLTCENNCQIIKIENPSPDLFSSRHNTEVIYPSYQRIFFIQSGTTIHDEIIAQLWLNTVGLSCDALVTIGASLAQLSKIMDNSFQNPSLMDQRFKKRVQKEGSKSSNHLAKSDGKSMRNR